MNIFIKLTLVDAKYSKTRISWFDILIKHISD